MDILKEIGILNSKPVDTPIDSKVKFLPWTKGAKGINDW